ncbi:MAG: hypothetical protein IJV96_03155 [Clostridia bacterium]|nr:hypothetical protein [Clostridia bacterium]
MKHLFRALGLLLCILPPAVATVEHFPLWLGRGESALSLLALLLLTLAAIPLFRILRERLKTPSAWLVWFLLWLFLTVSAPILSSVRVIALISFPTSLAGALCFRLAARAERNTE